MSNADKLRARLDAMGPEERNAFVGRIREMEKADRLDAAWYYSESRRLRALLVELVAWMEKDVARSVSYGYTPACIPLLDRAREAIKVKREPCFCDGIGEGPCPQHTACAMCGAPARYYAEDDTTPLCAECAA